MQIDTITLVGGTKARAKDVNDNVAILKNAIYALEEEVNACKSDLEEAKRRPTREIFDVYFSFSSQAPAGAYPLWTGEWVNHCRNLFPDFWRELQNRVEIGTMKACTNEEYEADLEEFGQCACFVIDDLNGHVRLPKLTRFISVIEEAAQLGTAQNDAVRNVTGSFALSPLAGSYVFDGAFSAERQEYTDQAGKGSRAVYFKEVTFDMSRQVPTADEARPKNVKLALYIQLANNTLEIAAMNTATIAEELTEAVATINQEEQAAVSAVQTALEEALAQLEASATLGDIESVLTNINGAY